MSRQNTLKQLAIVFGLFALYSCTTDSRIHYKENGVDVYGFKNGELKVGEWVHVSSKGDTILKERYNINGDLIRKQMFASDSGMRYLLLDQKYKFDSVVEELVFYPNHTINRRTITIDSVNFQKSYFANGKLQVVGKIIGTLPVDAFWQYYENGHLQIYSPNAGKDSTFIFDSLGNFVVTQIFKDYELMSVDSAEVDSRTLPVPPNGETW